MLITRRDWLSIAVSQALACLALPRSGGAADVERERSEQERRISRVIHEYEKQGFHRTGTATDRISGDWLISEVHKTGLAPVREMFSFSRVDPLVASVLVGDRRIDGLPLFDGGFTDATGVRGRLGRLQSDVAIALTEAPPNAAASVPLVDVRRQGSHQAIIIVTRGARPGLCPSNADEFLHPFGPPVLQVSSEEGGWLGERAQQGADAVVIAEVKRTLAQAFNVTATIQGSDRTRPPLIVMTPRSGWWWCASERGGGLACWLEMMRAMSRTKRARDVVFVASTGHEIGYRGIEVFVERRPGIVANSLAWIHLGTNIGAATNPGNTIQASDDELEGTLDAAMTGTGLRVDHRNPRGFVPGGEAAVVHKGGGRYVSIIGGSALFHNPADLGPEAVDIDTISRFAAAFTSTGKTLAGNQ